MPESNPLPKFLELTDERRAKIDEQQARLRAEAQSRGRLSPALQRVRSGMAHETAARADVEMLEAEMKHPPKGFVEGAHVDRLMNARLRLADALAHQGRYYEASAEVVGWNEDRRQEFSKMHEAVWRDDTDTCPCEPPKGEGEGLTHDHVMAEVISEKHDKLMPAIRCNNCGEVNVRPLTPELARHEDLRQQAKSALHGMSPENLKHKLAELLPEHLHDRKIFKR